MSQQFHRASTGDTITVPDVLAAKYEADSRWEPVASTAPAAELKGKDLDDALRAAGLSTSGKVAAKRDRLAEHQSHQSGEGDDTEENS